MVRLGRQLEYSTSLACGKARNVVIRSLLGLGLSLVCAMGRKASWKF